MLIFDDQGPEEEGPEFLTYKDLYVGDVFQPRDDRSRRLYSPWALFMKNNEQMAMMLNGLYAGARFNFDEDTVVVSLRVKATVEERNPWRRCMPLGE